jgi:hypothetical protein
MRRKSLSNSLISITDENLFDISTSSDTIVLDGDEKDSILSPNFS